MITIIGTGHVFNLAEPVSFIVKNAWPDAVLVELDERRMKAIVSDEKSGEKSTEVSPIYLQTAKYQQRMSEVHGSSLGSEFAAAVNTAKLAGADIVPIDKDAMRVMDEMWEEMSFSERMRYRFSGISDSVGGKRKVAAVRQSFERDENAYVDAMRKKYPTLVRKLIDERNAYMAERIAECSAKYSNMVIVVGDAHVEAIAESLAHETIRKIRLADLMDEERMKRVRDMVWKGET